jgi:hypothetical protein
LNDAINYKDIFDIIQTLNLAIYTPSVFILPSKLAKYVKDEENSKNGLSLVH